MNLICVCAVCSEYVLLVHECMCLCTCPSGHGRKSCNKNVAVSQNLSMVWVTYI